MCVGSTSAGSVVGSTAKPWFCVVISTCPVSSFSTGWFAPRWPNFSLNVFAPSARPSSWWPRQMPKIGFLPMQVLHGVDGVADRGRVAGAVREEDAVGLVRAAPRRPSRCRARPSPCSRPASGSAGCSTSCRSRWRRRAASAGRERQHVLGELRRSRLSHANDFVGHDLADEVAADHAGERLRPSRRARRRRGRWSRGRRSSRRGRAAGGRGRACRCPRCR